MKYNYSIIQVITLPFVVITLRQIDIGDGYKFVGIWLPCCYKNNKYKMKLLR